jgi:hypothetical protein
MNEAYHQICYNDDVKKGSYGSQSKSVWWLAKAKAKSGAAFRVPGRITRQSVVQPCGCRTS